MSAKDTTKLKKFKLTDGEKSAIAQLVESDGFKVLAKRIIPQRELQIALTNISMGNTERDLWYNKGMVYENSKLLAMIQDVADEYNKKQLDEDATDEV